MSSLSTSLGHLAQKAPGIVRPDAPTMQILLQDADQRRGGFKGRSMMLIYFLPALSLVLSAAAYERPSDAQSAMQAREVFCVTLS